MKRFLVVGMAGSLLALLVYLIAQAAVDPTPTSSLAGTTVEVTRKSTINDIGTENDPEVLIVQSEISGAALPAGDHGSTVDVIRTLLLETHERVDQFDGEEEYAKILDPETGKWVFTCKIETLLHVSENLAYDPVVVTVRTVEVLSVEEE